MDEVIGIQATRAVLRDNPQKGRCLYVQRGRRDARMNELISMAKDAGVRFQVVDDAWFKRRAADLKHQGVLLECHGRTLADEHAFKDAWPQFGEKPLILILDGLTDPRNLGACLRTANAAGVNAVILPKRNSAPLSAVALKTAQGGAEDLFIVQVTNLARCLTWLRDQGVWLLGADGEGEHLWHAMDTNVPLGLVMGSEGKGLRRLTRSLCDQLVSIPMLGRVESLNVAVATGVLLFEVVRQRSQPRKVS